MDKTELKEYINEKWDDEEVLEYFGLFLDRVNVATSFLQNEDGGLTHSVCVFQVNDKVIVSEPAEFEWPLMMMPKPEAFSKKEVN
jgi:hypothetical protein